MDAHPTKLEFVYCSGKAVVRRSLQNPADCDVFLDHAANAIVARYAPSGNQLASGDESGKVMVWSAGTKVHQVDCSPIGSVVDMAWSFDNERIAVVGSGQERRASVIFAKTGAQVSPLPNLQGRVNVVAFRPARPIRVVACSEDRACNLYSGPPFTAESSVRDHEREVTDAKFIGAKGERFVTVGGDGALFIYDSSTGAQVSALKAAHSKAIYSVAVSPDATRLLTTSADRTVRIWDIATLQAVTTFNLDFTNSWQDSMLGSIWRDKYLVSVSAGESLFFLDADTGAVRTRLDGHTRSVTGMVRSADGAALVTSGIDNRLVQWDLASGVGTSFAGKGHDAALNAVALAAPGRYATGAVNGSVVLSNADDKRFGDVALELDSGVRAMTADGQGNTFVCGRAEVVVLHNGAKTQTLALGAEPQSVALSPDRATLAVGCANNQLLLFSATSVSADALAFEATPARTLTEHRGPVSSVVFSPDGRWLASGDAQHIILLWDRAAEYAVAESGWSYHTSRIEALAFSPDSRHLVSCGRDAAVYVWSVERRDDKVQLLAAHRSGAVAAQWLSDSRFATSGADYTVKLWQFAE